DGDMDIVVAGQPSQDKQVTLLYINDGNANFTLENYDLIGVLHGSVTFSDIDSDQRPDLLITGISHPYSMEARLYQNLLCTNQTDSTHISACGPYVWMDGKTYTSSTDSAIYLKKDPFGCDSLFVLDLTMEPLDLSVTQNPGLLTANASAIGYQWLDCNNMSPVNGAISQSFSPVINGNYAVVITGYGCVDTSACFSIQDVSLMDSKPINIHPYPNPTTDMVNITVDGMADIEIYNSVGQRIDQIPNVSGREIQLHFKGEPGLYFIKVKYGNELIGRYPVIKQ
ncbi:MAG: T9SS type A sorting domain-containing protein, partial [Owenweeksia sp.]